MANDGRCTVFSDLARGQRGSGNNLRDSGVSRADGGRYIGTHGVEHRFGPSGSPGSTHVVLQTLPTGQSAWLVHGLSRSHAEVLSAQVGPTPSTVCPLQAHWSVCDSN